MMWTTAANASHEWACIDRVGPWQLLTFSLHSEWLLYFKVLHLFCCTQQGCPWLIYWLLSECGKTVKDSVQSATPGGGKRGRSEGGLARVEFSGLSASHGMGLLSRLSNIRRNDWTCSLFPHCWESGRHPLASLPFTFRDHPSHDEYSRGLLRPPNCVVDGMFRSW